MEYCSNNSFQISVTIWVEANNQVNWIPHHLGLWIILFNPKLKSGQYTKALMLRPILEAIARKASLVVLVEYFWNISEITIYLVNSNLETSLSIVSSFFMSMPYWTHYKSRSLILFTYCLFECPEALVQSEWLDTQTFLLSLHWCVLNLSNLRKTKIKT